MKAKSCFSDWFCDDCSKRIASELLLHRLGQPNGIHYDNLLQLKDALKKFVAVYLRVHDPND